MKKKDVKRKDEEVSCSHVYRACMPAAAGFVPLVGGCSVLSVRVRGHGILMVYLYISPRVVYISAGSFGSLWWTAMQVGIHSFCCGSVFAPLARVTSRGSHAAMREETVIKQQTVWMPLLRVSVARAPRVPRFRLVLYRAWRQ
jgi:hypothetical protein